MLKDRTEAACSASADRLFRTSRQAKPAQGFGKAFPRVGNIHGQEADALQIFQTARGRAQHAHLLPCLPLEEAEIEASGTGACISSHLHGKNAIETPYLPAVGPAPHNRCAHHLG